MYSHQTRCIRFRFCYIFTLRTSFTVLNTAIFSWYLHTCDYVCRVYCVKSWLHKKCRTSKVVIHVVVFSVSKSGHNVRRRPSFVGSHCVSCVIIESWNNQACFVLQHTSCSPLTTGWLYSYQWINEGVCCPEICLN